MSEQQKPYRIEGRPQTIYRVVKSADNPYVMIDRRPIDNPNLSFKAKGILTYLMSRPDGWEVSVADLINHTVEGEASVRSGLKELKVAGHLKYTSMRQKGRITGWLIEVFEVIPPHSDFQDVEIQDVENRTQVLSTLSTNELKHGSFEPTTIEQAIWADKPVTEEMVNPEKLFRDKVKDTAHLLDMGCKGGGDLAAEFMLSRWLIIPESKIKGNRKAAREMLEMGVKPEHVEQAVADLTAKGMTITDLFSISKTAIDLANKSKNTPVSKSFGL